MVYGRDQRRAHRREAELELELAPARIGPSAQTILQLTVDHPDMTDKREGKESVLLANIRSQTPMCSGTIEWLQGLACGRRRLAVRWDDVRRSETRALQIDSLILKIFILV